MPQPTDTQKPTSGFSRFSKALPAVPQLLHQTTSLPLSAGNPQKPPKRKELPPPPPPPPRDILAISPSPTDISSSISPRITTDAPLPQLPVKSPPLPVPGAFPDETVAPETLAVPAPTNNMAIPRRPVGLADHLSPSSLSPFPEPSPTVSISSLISAYGRSPTTPNAYPAAPSPSRGDGSPPLPPVFANPKPPGGRDKKLPLRLVPKSPPLDQSKSIPALALSDTLPPRPPAKDSLADQSSPPAVPSKSEIWRRRPQNDARDIPGLKLQQSHGSTVSSGTSTMSSSSASTQRPATAVRDEPTKSLDNTIRKPPALGGLPGRNIRPNISKDTDTPPARKPNLYQSRSAMPLNAAAAPPANRPPTPEYQKGEVRAPAVATFTKPASPAASPESPSRFSPGHAKSLPHPPPQGLESKRDAESEAKGISRTTTPKLRVAHSTGALTDMPRRKPASSHPTLNGGSSPIRPTLTLRTDSLASSTPSPAVRTPTSESGLSASESRGSSVSPTRQGRNELERTPRQQRPQRRPAGDPRIVQTDAGPMYRGRGGTLYPEMTSSGQADPRARYFPTWKAKDATNVHVDGIFHARELRESHYSCFQKHGIMNRRNNRNYPLTCQTCSKANADDRWACAFCHLRICETCFRVFDMNRRDLKRLVAEVGRRTPLSLSSDSRPASAFGL